jgi:hypothetical protein
MSRVPLRGIEPDSSPRGLCRVRDGFENGLRGCDLRARFEALRRDVSRGFTEVDSPSSFVVEPDSSLLGFEAVRRRAVALGRRERCD